MGKRICVYCCSSNRIAPKYIEAAAQFARLAALQGHTLVCGGTSKGLMGVLAGATVEAGGTIEGVVPEFMVQYGWDDKRLTHLKVAENMRERKHLMMKDADAIVALPGAVGTLEELAEAISLKRLGQFCNPIIIFNQDGFYDSLLLFFDDMVRERMMGADQCQVWKVVTRVEDILPAIDAEPTWAPDMLHYHDSNEYGNQ
ncbi:MAG: TIGR00730 family Rossman fold protein [Bacteroidales bacterium]|nr:TIGR00730 family Rossman fold protein [Bacteroidales bacterium]